MNTFYADAYRLRKGTATRNTVIGLAVTVLFIVLSLVAISSTGLMIYLDNLGGESEILSEQDKIELESLRLPQNAAEFGREILGENMVPLFALVFVVAVFSSDFSAGTYRNTLTHSHSRGGIYRSKLCLSLCCCLGLNLLAWLFATLFGGLFKGFGGLSGAYLLQSLAGMLLLFLTQIGLVCFGHCLAALTRKSSATIAGYLVTLTVFSSFVQILALRPRLAWLSLLDWNSSGSLLVNYASSTPAQLLIPIGSSLLLAAVCTAIGLRSYRRADLA